MPAFDQATIDEYTASGSWDGDRIADLVARNAAADPDGLAFIAPDATLTWRQYDEASTRLAGLYGLGGCAPGDLVAVLLTGGALTHVAYLAAQKAGLVTVGLGPRAGDGEVRQLLAQTGARTLLTRPVHRGRDTAGLVAGLGLDHHLAVELTGDAGLAVRLDGAAAPVPDLDTAATAVAGRGLGPDDLFFLNSTSGTTGLPKCVMQTMNTRKYFGRLAARAAGFGPDEVFASVLPAPYGFGLWSAHIVPTMLGRPTVLTEEFDAEQTLALLQEHRVTVLAAVTSQFIMMLNSPALAVTDLSALRTMFTGGERVPYRRAVEFEERAGCVVLQFYGSNEAGPVSVTSAADDREHRLRTSGRAIEEMRLRLFAADGTDVTATGGPGQCAVRGPGITPGYFGDPAATRSLFRPDGWLLTGDIMTVDGDGYLTLTGRAADFIIRGGHNISVLVVEDAVGGHPRVAQVAVVAVTDEVLGERVGAYVVTRDGGELTLDELRAHLAAAGVSKHNWPERLVTLPALPLSAGGKADKARLRADAAERFRASESRVDGHLG
jgi:acyl-CoA synthetase